MWFVNQFATIRGYRSSSNGSSLRGGSSALYYSPAVAGIPVPALHSRAIAVRCQRG